MHQAFDYGISTMELLFSGRTMGTEFLEWNYLLSGRTMVLPGMSDALAREPNALVGDEIYLPRVVLYLSLSCLCFCLCSANL